MTKEEKEMLSHKIAWEGFDYCFIDYSDWEEIKDEEFQKLLKAYKEAREVFHDYLEEEGINFDL